MAGFLLTYTPRKLARQSRAAAAISSSCHNTRAMTAEADSTFFLETGAAVLESRCPSSCSYCRQTCAPQQRSRAVTLQRLRYSVPVGSRRRSLGRITSTRRTHNRWCRRAGLRDPQPLGLGRDRRLMVPRRWADKVSRNQACALAGGRQGARKGTRARAQRSRAARRGAHLILIASSFSRASLVRGARSSHSLGSFADTLATDYTGAGIAGGACVRALRCCGHLIWKGHAKAAECRRHATHVSSSLA